VPIVLRALVLTALSCAADLALRAAWLPALERNVDAVAGFLHVFGAIYGTVLAFLIFVVWGQFNGTEAGIAREAKTLEELVRLCRAGRSQGCREMVDAVHHYAALASDDEWKALGAGRPCPSADHAFLKVQEVALRTDANTEIEELTRDVILRLARRAAELRAERIAISNTRIPPTLWRTLMFATLGLCLSVSLLGVTEVDLSLLLTGGLTLVVTLILGVVDDMDNPFDGIYNASKKPLEELRSV
jgi:hypothetical protein